MTTDALFSRWGAHLLREEATLRSILVGLAESNLTKALFVAPCLLLAWYGSDRGAAGRRRVLAVPFSCALALGLVWCVTSTWLRPRPIDPRAGYALVSEVFLPCFSDRPGLLRWGSFPSDHSAYLTALSLGVATWNRRVGLAAFGLAVLLNGGLRLATGLHHASDVMAGILVGLTAHWIVFRVAALPERRWVAGAERRIDRSLPLQALLVVTVVEMSVLFADLRFLDRLVFG